MKENQFMSLKGILDNYKREVLLQLLLKPPKIYPHIKETDRHIIFSVAKTPIVPHRRHQVAETCADLQTVENQRITRPLPLA